MLDAATEVFWRHGYDGASLEELTAAMGLNRPSLYAAFGNKHDLFIAVLDHYGAGAGRKPIAAFDAEDNITAAVRAFLEISLKGNTRRNGARGCLFACCASTSAGSSPEVRKRLSAAYEATEARLRTRFRAEAAAGRLPAEPSPEVRAAHIIDLMNAQAIRARAGASRANLMAALEDRVAAVLREGKK
ncbi:MAG: TetR/AcrR family transcriptional regulator [Elainellaceae cyanobacterium]